MWTPADVVGCWIVVMSRSANHNIYQVSDPEQRLEASVLCSNPLELCSVALIRGGHPRGQEDVWWGNNAELSNIKTTNHGKEYCRLLLKPDKYEASSLSLLHLLSFWCTRVVLQCGFHLRSRSGVENWFYQVDPYERGSIRHKRQW